MIDGGGGRLRDGEAHTGMSVISHTGRKRDRNDCRPQAVNVTWGQRERVLAALAANAWRRQDTAQYLGIRRKVLWEKMRKYQIFEEEPETRQTEG